ncbi:hypothetical protein [Actinopolymorpha pittospori]|uniref:Uncharacterized protein n=1 Tax=Actinopolymorpha pittospori TaxID=648752 RepID=A0A927RAZ3_9ACTN|nr:hypothetical protein [Actinopolymorpha pittospori]MBE1605565.1 hypothetical protein [Actinopolymorpha pittospori]
MADRDDVLRAARLRLDATAELERIKLNDEDMETAAQLLADLWTVLHAYGAFDDCMADVANVPKLAVLTTQAVRRHNRALAAVADPATYNPYVISGPLRTLPIGQASPTNQGRRK